MQTNQLFYPNNLFHLSVDWQERRRNFAFEFEQTRQEIYLNLITRVSSELFTRNHSSGARVNTFSKDVHGWTRFLFSLLKFKN